MIPTADRMFLAALCLARAGLRVDAEKSYLIESRLGPLARREGFASPEAFIENLRQRADERQGWAAVEAMIQPETEFYRDRRLFERLIDTVLPELVRARGGAPVRVWSTACGAGQEIYSLGMMLAESPALARQVELFASDLSERSLEKAQSGVYSQFEAQRGLPARALVRHFEKIGDSFVLSPRVRQMVRWRRVNLLDDLAALGQFDVILCRTLLGQLTSEAQARVMQSLERALAPGGRLALAAKVAAGPGLECVDTDLGLYAARDDRRQSAA